MTKQRPRRARVLTNVRVDEISCVDAGAGEGVKIVLMKRDHAALDGGELVFEPPVEDDEGHDDEINDTSGEPTKHLNELVEQLEKERAMKSKSLDVIRVCKAMADDGDAYGTSEHELVDWLGRYAKAHDTTFVALYERNDDVGLAIRKAITIAKNAQFVSRTSTFSKAQPQFSDRSSKPYHAAGAVDGRAGKPGVASLRPRVTTGWDGQAVDDPRAAIDLLNELAAEQRKNHPELSDAGAFSQVYMDPRNAELVRREREENRPTSAAWGG
jgi:hypothetical protein